MKLKYIRLFIVCLIIINIISIVVIYYKTKVNEQIYKIYMFEGENNELSINNGLIIITPKKQTIIGGEMTYLKGIQDYVKSYSKKLFIDKSNKEENIIFRNSINFNDVSLTQTSFEKMKIGEVTGQNIIKEEYLNDLSNKLYFTFEYTTGEGITINSTVKLEVREVELY